MKFILDSLKSGWLDARIEHDDKCVYIYASNIMGGDFVGDLMIALYESISGDVTRMVVYSNENSDFGILLQSLPNDHFRIARIGIDCWNEIVFADLEKAKKNFSEVESEFKKCGVYRDEVIINEGMFVEDLGEITKLELIRFASIIISEFSYYKSDEGNLYYNLNWISNSDAIMDKKIPGFPYQQYNSLSCLMTRAIS